MTAEYTLTLVDPRACQLELAGGKGASLARMASQRLRVPGGFVITTRAYRRLLEANSLQDPVLQAATEASPGDPASRERASETIQGLFSKARMPREVTTAIRRAYTALGEEVPVAVRSSAIAEDLPGMSFAGQQESYLNMRGEEAVLDAVRRCWASLWTARAIAYRTGMGVEHSSVSMAVVAQEMVPSEASGVLFTANPTTGERSEMFVNASFGLGEAVVSGQVTPDSFLLDKASLRVKEGVLGAKETEVVPGDGQGTVSTQTSQERRKAPSLSEGQLRELGELAIRVEQLFGGTPQDIEWASAEGRVYLLQARPMTGLPPAPLKEVRWDPPIPRSAWIRRQVVENMPDPLSPLFDELYLRDGLEYSMEGMQKVMGVPRHMIDTLFDRPMFATVNGYAYMRGNINFHWWSVPVLLPVVLGAMAIGVAKILRNAGVVYWLDDAMPGYLATVDRWRAVEVETASDERLLDGVRELARADAVYWFAVALAMGTAKSTDVMLDRFLAIALPGRGLSAGLFLRGFRSRAVDAEAELEGVASSVRGSAELRETVAATPARRLLDVLEECPPGQPVVKELRDYLDRHGHQIYSLDFAVPTLAEDPLPVMLSLKSLLAQPQRDVRARQEAMARERDHLAEETARSLDPVRRAVFVRLVRMAQGFAPYREESLFHMGAGWPTLRRLAFELGQRLVASGSLRSPGDVFYLQTSELAEASAARVVGQARPELVRLASERRELREARKRLHPPAAVPVDFRWKLGPIDLAGREGQRRDTATGPTMRGFAVSPGRVTAPATVILSPSDFERMVPDTILVCPTTTPAWTPLFAQAKGLVTDIGGVAAHGSIVAREYGIPAVMGTGSATQRVANGQRITVDGNNGTVVLPVESGEAEAERPGPEPVSGAPPPSGKGRALRFVVVAGLVMVVVMRWSRRRRRSEEQP